MTTTTLIVGSHVLNITETHTDAPYALTVGLQLDYEHSWLFETAGWQPMSYGVHKDTAYLWSATDLILVPLDTPEPGPLSLKIEDTLIVVFGVDNYWLLICETSIRLLSENLPAASYEFGEVLLTARWEGSHCVIESDLGSIFRVRVVDGALMLGD